MKVATSSGEIIVDVDHGLTGVGYPSFFLRSSRSRAVVLPGDGEWPVGLPWSIADRLRNSGDEKGRVLAVWQELPRGEAVPVAVLAWHVHESGPLCVLDAGYSGLVGAADGLRLTTMLLHVLLEAAAHHNASVAGEWHRTLRWSQVALAHAPHRDRPAYCRANLRRAVALQFAREPIRPQWARRAWLGERRFS